MVTCVRVRAMQTALLWLLPLFLFAQPDNEKFGFFLTNGAKLTRIPFELHSNLIIIPLKVNDSDTLRFILDTGVSSIIVTDPHVLKKQNLKATRRVKLTGAGEGQDVSASVAIGNTLRMGRMKATHQNIVIIDEDILRLSEYVGVPVHGIFGFELFNNFVVTIDFRNRELLLLLPSFYKYRPRKGDKFPIVIEDTKPYADMVALVENGQEMPIRVVIDTGAGHALLLDPSGSREQPVHLPEKVIRAQLGRGLSGVINGSLGRIKKIKLGKHELDDVLASFPDSLSFGVKIGSHTERQGNMGCELLRRFTVTFNYPERYMVLKPLKKRLHETFEHDMSGMELRAKGDNLRSYFIDRVLDDSPAGRAGLEEGDEILFINNNPAGELSISEIYKILQKGEGKEVNLLVRRRGNVQFAKFNLKRMI
jgi:predicted aspartyl protease